MGSGVFNRGSYLLMTGGIDWRSADLRYLVITADVAPTHALNTVADLLAAGCVELTGGGSGYSRGALASKTVAQDDANNRAKAGAADVVFASLAASAGTPAYLVAFLEDATESLRQLVCWTDHTLGARVPNGAPYTLSFGAAGLLVGDTDAA